MIIAGIDEAGYGPLLGPLVVGCCAFEINGVAAGEVELSQPLENGEADFDEGSAGSGGVAAVAPPAVVSHLPCVWKRLRRYVSRNRSKTGRKIHVNDSKQVYSPSIGLKELERSVLALCHTMTPSDADDGSLDALLKRLAPHCPSELAEHPWYAPLADEVFPLSVEPLPVRLFAKALRQEMQKQQTHCVHLAARVVSERPFNRMLAQTRNKASVLFTQAATHLDYLLNTYADRELFIFCDRQGGRSSYGSLLRMMFPEWSLEILEEVDGRSEYVMTQGDRRVQLLFAEKAEAQCLPVAAASMVSKYLRESLMSRFNRWWAQHVPNIEPTAGYYNDGLRFVQDIAAARTRLGIRDEHLIRAK